MSTLKRLALVLTIATVMMLLAAGVALAGGTNIPHGGYEEHGGVDTSTDACLQCHDIHEAGGDYVLLRWTTVLDTCGSCHYLYEGAYPNGAVGSFGQGSYTGAAVPGITPAYRPGYYGNSVDPNLNDVETDYSPDISGSNSLGGRTSAYEVVVGTRYTHNGHRVQMGDSPEALGNLGEYLFADGETKGAAYIPGSSKTLTAIKKAAYGSTVPNTDYDATNGLYCASCHTPHGNFGQQLLKTGTASETITTKLLSGAPNHSEPNLTLNSWAEGNQWCERCHDRRSSGSTTTHNHPSSYCLTCHANATDDGEADGGDFPHTGDNANLLSKEPDALCVGCHKKGFLP